MVSIITAKNNLLKNPICWVAICHFQWLPVGIMSRQHGSKQINRFIREIQRLGFNVETTRNKYRITPPPHLGTRVYFTHGTIKAIKPLCADFKKLYGVELDPKKFL